MTVQDAAASAIAELSGRDCAVRVLGAEGQQVCEFFGRYHEADPVDEDGREITLRFRTIEGNHAAGEVTLRAADFPGAEWRETVRRGARMVVCEGELVLRSAGCEVVVSCL